MKEPSAPEIRLDRQLKYIEPRKKCLSCGVSRPRQPRYFGMFYGMLLLVFFGYAYMQREQGLAPIKAQTVAHGRTIQYTAVEENNRKGFSLLFQNGLDTPWNIKSVMFDGQRHEISISVEPKGIYGVFVPAETAEKTRSVKFSGEETQ